MTTTPLTLFVLLLGLFFFLCTVSSSSSYPVSLHGYRQCNPNLCHNGGTCVYNSFSKPFCRCPPRYAGHLCEHTNPCFAANRCMNGGTCQTITSPHSPPTFKCLCPLGFSASLCEVEEPNVCLQTRPCENGGRCVLKGDVDNFECQCAPGWRGPRCEEADNCVSQPCRNGAICHSHSNGTATSAFGFVGYTCDCAPGFRGPTCGEDIDECAEQGSAKACNQNGVCINTPGSYRCNCEQDYTGQFCETRYVPCQVNPCLSGGDCVPHYSTSTYKCVCPTGFTGHNCEINVDDCGGHLCQNGGSCVDGVNTYSCACPANFSGPYCSQDVDECSLRPHVCQNGATCANTNGGFACICVNGWTGPTCGENIDDCSNQPCFNGATCHDRVGSFFCQCPPGKTGLLCHLEDACASNPCHAGSICDTSPLDGTYVCSCPTGYKGTDCTLDIDECQDSGSPCEHGGTCVNTPGSFKCDCALGFAGTRCEININECDSNPCQNEGTCLDERGSYRCVCMP
ncbi:PREDICTED: neurogenic locus Notch protein-like, partial [Rhagoletis zephyria]|uniref:neurogenic locus Notch protein-like n=1 Tax=Rhagoletis zephyria TaxID=28612 RepID=UPI0008119359